VGRAGKPLIRFVTPLLTALPQASIVFAPPRRRSLAMPRIQILIGIATLLTLAAAPRPAAAQRHSATLVGWIRDSSGAPVGQADVLVEHGDAAARTDSSGRFTLRALDPGAITVRVRRLGYDPQTFEYVLRAGSEDSISVTLLPRIHSLEAVEIDEAMAKRRRELDGFNRRKAQGEGMFVTRMDIEHHNTEMLSETLREVPGLRFTRAGPGRQGLRFITASTKSYDCQPLYWVDGRKVLGVEIDDFPASEVEAIELYRGPATTPAQFAPGRSNATCGTVVIWTRVPPQ
jgi:hypothetical protein